MAKRIPRTITKKRAEPQSFQKTVKDSGVPFTHIVMKRTWNAERADSRLLIRQELFKLTKDRKVLDFSTVSKCDSGYFSISHNPTYGALITSSQPIGIDIEALDRPVSPKTFQRLASLEERKLDLLPIEMWVLKEAAFKACTCVGGISTISEINIRALKKNISENFFEFDVIRKDINKLTHSGQGVLLRRPNTTLGIAWLKA